jgi:Pregnancy-associated plasma protein-A
MLTMLFIVTITFAQIVFPPAGCGNNIIYHDNNFNRNATTIIPDNPLTPLVLNISFTMINDAPNHNNANLTTNEAVENKFLFLIKLLNTNYNQHNIFFKYKGYKVEVNATISNGNYQYIVFPGIPNPPYIENNIAQYKVENCINVYCINQLGYGGLAYVAGDVIYLNTPMLTENNIINNTLENTIVHEMGHCLSLYHTYESGSHFIYTHPLYPKTLCEHVTRNVFDLEYFYNADIAGDEVVDTPATPLANSEMFQPNCGSYIYDVSRHDCDTPPAPYENILIGNFMNYGFHECQQSFTAGQVKRMREFIINSNYLYAGAETPQANSYTNIQDIRNTVESLYKPYSWGKLVLPEPISQTNNGDGTINVCRRYYSADYKFQPGFTYTFLETLEANANVLSTTTVDTFPVFIAQPVFNCPIQIAELVPGQTNLSTNIAQAETICRGIVCADETLLRGEDIKVKILGSLNYTIEQLDAVQVKDPELFDKLMSEYYHILRMYTSSGAKIETVIYKQ